MPLNPHLTCISMLVLALSFLLDASGAEEMDLNTMIQTIGPSGSADLKKQAFLALEKRAHLGEYAVGEMTKRGVMKPLFNTIKADGDPLLKELALAVLSEMTLHSVATCDSVIDSGILSNLITIIRRGTTTAQMHSVSILARLANLSKQHRTKLLGIKEILDSVVFALRSGTKETREKAAAFVVSVTQNEMIKTKLIELEAVEHLQKLTLHGTPKAKQNAAKALEKLGGEIPPEADIPPAPKPTTENTNKPNNVNNNNNNINVNINNNNNNYQTGADVRTHTYTFTSENGFEKVLEDPVREWWGSTLKQTRRVAQNQYTLRSPSRFRHK